MRSVEQNTVSENGKWIECWPFVFVSRHKPEALKSMRAGARIAHSSAQERSLSRQRIAARQRESARPWIAALLPTSATRPRRSAPTTLRRRGPCRPARAPRGATFRQGRSGWATTAPMPTPATTKAPCATFRCRPFASLPPRSPMPSSPPSSAPPATSPTPSAPAIRSSSICSWRRRSGCQQWRARWRACHGGCGSPMRRGSVRRGPARTSSTGPAILSFTCRGAMRPRIAPGRRHACRARPSGSAPRAAGSKESASPGATN